MRRSTILWLLFLWLPGLAAPRAQAADLPLWDWGHFTGAAHAGYLGFKPYGAAGSPWSGVSTAGALGYNLDALSAWVSLEHDFPVGDSQGHKNMARAFVNARLRAYEGRARGQLYAGAGFLSLGNLTSRDWTGAEGHLTGSVLVTEGLRLSATYSHAFALRPGFDDFDFYRAALVARIF